MATSNPGWNRFKAVAAVFAIAMSVVVLIWQYQRIDRRHTYRPAADEVVGVRLGQGITELAPAGQIVVVAFRPVDELDETSAAILRGFKRSVPETRELQHVSVEEVARLLFGDQNIDPIAEGGMPPQVFDAIVREHAQAAALVSLAGLPPRYSQPAYSARQRPRIGVADVLLLSENAWIHCLKQDLVDFIILPRLDAPIGQAGSREKEFSENFHFVTKQNVGEVSEEYQAIY